MGAMDDYQRRRDAVTEYLAEHGDATYADLEPLVGGNLQTVRRTVRSMQGEGLVAQGRARGGKPTYLLTRQASPASPVEPQQEPQGATADADEDEDAGGSGGEEAERVEHRPVDLIPQTLPADELDDGQLDERVYRALASNTAGVTNAEVADWLGIDADDAQASIRRLRKAERIGKKGTEGRSTLWGPVDSEAR